MNPAFAKTLKTIRVFRFLGSKAVYDSLGRPKKAPKRHLNGSKTFTNRGPTKGQIFTIFWTHFGIFFGVKESLLARVLRTPGVAKTENKREGRKRESCWKHIQQKKGRDKALKGLRKPLTSL